ncbi:MAG: DUF202 domain-containing protein [Alphaproteobacteria bacterium]|nr:DUF202 domain-containing protein [Alphaproteobacteria bacterium]MCB9792088.1 DUF202 domain-containing protein [Alphaproteobacteria bacterium]
MTTYEMLDPEDLGLRDQLAADRTALAYERTILGYVRTGAAAFLGGVTVLKVLVDPTLLWVAYALIVGGPLSSVIGIALVMRRWKRIRHLTG